MLRAIAALALITYPVLAWFGLQSGSPRSVALLLLLVMTPAFAWRARRSANAATRGLVAVPLTMLAILTLSAVFDDRGAMLATPVVANAVLLVAFGSTLRPGSMPMVERFARLQEPSLDAPKQAWCRRWTWLWCAFFTANGSVALLLATTAPLSWWALYNGGLCYLLIGAMFAVEWLLRRARFGASTAADTSER